MYYTFNHLKALVKSMSVQEKRNFTLFSRLYRSSDNEPLYLQLFQTIASDKSEATGLPEASSPEAKTTAQKQLFRNIRRSLRLYHEEQSVETILQAQLTDIEVLYRLSLPDQGLHLLRKAMQLAKTHEKFSILLQLLKWEKRLNIVLDTPTRSNEEIRQEEADILRKLQQIMELENIYGRAKELKKLYGYVKGVMKKDLKEETISAQGMPAHNECLSNTANYYYNFIHALFHWMTFNHVAAYEYSQRLVSPTVQVVLPNDYVDGILEHVTSCICLCRFDAALHGLEVCAAYIREQKLNQSHSFTVRIFYYQVCYHIIIFNYTGNKKKLSQTIADAEEKLKRYDSMLSQEMKKVIAANLMNAYLGVGNMGKVNELWDILFARHANAERRRDIYDDLYLFRLFNLFQNGHFWLIRSMASSAFRYYKSFKDHQTHFQLELKIASLLQKNIDLEDTETRDQVLLQIKAMIQEYISGLSGANHFQEQYTLYEIWINSLIGGKPFHQEAKEWYRRFPNSSCNNPLIPR